MKVWAWTLLGGFAFACGGSAFTGAGDGGRGGEGGSESGASSGGSSSKAGSGGSGQGAGAGGKSSQGGVINAGGDLAIGGEPTAGGAPPAGGTGSTAGAGTAGASSAGTGGTGNPDPVDKVCPKTQPTAGTGCMGELTCTYTNDVRPACRPYATCENGKWAVVTPDCEVLPACPALQVGKPCDAEVQDPCMLSEDQGIYCVCTGCSGTGGPCSTETSWACAAGAGGVGCPAFPPNRGQACSGEFQCGYGSCSTSNGLTVRCDGSVWQWELLECPL